MAASYPERDGQQSPKCCELTYKDQALFRSLKSTLYSAFYFVIVGCPDGSAAALTGLVLELVYRAFVALEIVQPGFEYFSLVAGLVAFVALFAYRAAIYSIRKKRSNR